MRATAASHPRIRKTQTWKSELSDNLLAAHLLELDVTNEQSGTQRIGVLRFCSRSLTRSFRKPPQKETPNLIGSLIPYQPQYINPIKNLVVSIFTLSLNPI